MKHYFTTVTSKGQFTVPKRLREHLGLKRGDRLLLDVDAKAGRITFLQDRWPAEHCGDRRQPCTVCAAEIGCVMPAGKRRQTTRMNR